MLNTRQIKEIKDHLNNAQNPIFFFDNDQDGLCSFLLLQRYLDRGKGIAIKSFPDLDESYFRKVQELNADYVFILDKPVVSKNFFDRLSEVNIPVVWIDHHDVDSFVPDFVHYYNPAKEGNGTEPVTALCWQISQRKEDKWIAVLGCITDIYIPEYYQDFLNDYPDLGIKSKSAFDILYNSKLGEMARIVGSGLKDTTTNVVNMLKFLTKAKSPYEIFEESNKTHHLHQRYNQIYKKYKQILEKAKKSIDREKVVFFTYSGDLSISGELSNEIYYNFPKKVIVVGYINGSKINLSLRGENIREKFLEAIKDISGATGGGHANAVGGQINAKDFNTLKEKLTDMF